MNRGVAVVLSLLVALVLVGCSGERFVDGVVIDNGTVFDVNVDVTDASRDGWLPLAVVGAQSEIDVGQIYDQGATWIFRFSFGGYQEEIEMERADLARSNWRIDVPVSFAEALRDRGVVPPP